MNISVFDSASPILLRAASGVSPARIAPVAGRAAHNLVRDHLFAYNGTHANQLGGKRTNFYAQAARSTTMRADRSGATVSINLLGFRLQHQGGTVRPTGGRRYLTIPAVPEAHGKLAGEFDNLEFAIARSGSRVGPALVESRMTQIRITKGKGGPKVKALESTTGTRVIYWLVRSATIKPHADVLPTPAALQEHVRAAAVSYMTRIVDRRAKSLI